MNTNNNFYRDEYAADGVGSIIIPFETPSAAAPKVKILRPAQFRDNIGTLVDINSKCNKTINQQTSLANLMEWLLKDCCKRSNGGLIAFGINQKELINKTITTKTKGIKQSIPKDTLTRCLNNLLHHKILVKVSDYEVGKVANQYILGEIVLALLDPVKTDKKNTNTCSKAVRGEYESMGYNVDDKKICPISNRELFITEFEIDQDTFLLVPICWDMRRGNKGKIINVDCWNQAWRNFNLEKQYCIRHDIDAHTLDKMKFNGEFELLMKEVGGL